jgi:hypothetical protein
MIKSCLCALALATTLPVLAEEFAVPLPGREGLVMDLPSGWKAQVRRPDPALPPTIAVTDSDPKAFQVLITPVWPAAHAKAPTGAEIRHVVQLGADQARPRATEAELKLHDLDSSGKYGYYFSATDRAPGADGYKYLTQGALGVSELRVDFKVQANEPPSPATDKALELLRSVRRTSAKTAP